MKPAISGDRPRFQFIGGSLALDFLNTVGNRLSGARDYFRHPDDVRVWAAAAGLLDERPQAVGLRTDAERRRVIRARERLYGIFGAIVDGRPIPAGALAWLNRTVLESARRRRLVPAPAGLAWAEPATVRVPDLIVDAAVRDAVALLTSGAPMPLARCTGANCGWLFLDRSRGGRRKWCSMADCGNREKAKRHYRRLRPVSPSTAPARGSAPSHDSPSHAPAPSSPRPRRSRPRSSSRTDTE